MRISDWSSDVCSSDLLGDIAQARALAVDHQVAQLLQVVELADRLHAQALSAVVDLPGGHREVDRLQACVELVDTDVVGGQAVREIGRASCRERVCQYV